jgi:phage repressor protein C with HTH and peptisase S24 domain
LHKPGSLLRQGVAGREVLAVTVDVTGTEQVELVTQKAAAGYLSGYQDPEFVRELPKIQLPVLPRNCTVRAFEIRGDSMLPIRPGSIVFGRFVESLAHIKNGNACILVTQQDGIVFKRVFHDTEHPHNLLLVSDNTRYAPYRLPYAEVREVWEALGVYSAME